MEKTNQTQVEQTPLTASQYVVKLLMEEKKENELLSSLLDESSKKLSSCQELNKSLVELLKGIADLFIIEKGEKIPNDIFDLYFKDYAADISTKFYLGRAYLDDIEEEGLPLTTIEKLYVLLDQINNIITREK